MSEDPMVLQLQYSKSQGVHSTNQCYNQYIVLTNYMTKWWTGNSAIATANGPTITGVGVGSTSQAASGQVPTSGFRQCPYITMNATGGTNVIPVISGPNKVWWFSGQSPNPATWPTQITLSTSASGSWKVNSGASEVQLSTSTGSSIDVQGTGTFSQTANDVSITVTVNGMTSAPFTLTSDGPKLLANPSNIAGALCQSSQQGWEYDKTYEVLDNFNNIMKGLPVSEGLNTASVVWPPPAPTGGTTDSGTGQFTDKIFICATPPNGLSPMPQNYTNGSGTTLVDQIPQTWCAGSSISGSACTGGPVQSDHIQRYLDHGNVTIP